MKHISATIKAINRGILMLFLLFSGTFNARASGPSVVVTYPSTGTLCQMTLNGTTGQYEPTRTTLSVTTSSIGSIGPWLFEVYDYTFYPSTLVVYSSLLSYTSTPVSIDMVALLVGVCGNYNRDIAVRVTDQNTSTTYYSTTHQVYTYAVTGSAISSSNAYEYTLYHCPGDFSPVASLYGATPACNSIMTTRTYQWQVATSATTYSNIGGATSITYSPTSNGTYRCLVSYGSCIEAVMYHIKDAVPEIVEHLTQTAATVTLTSGAPTADLEVVPSSFQTYSAFQWYRNGQIITSGGTSNTITVSQKGVYHLVTQGSQCGEQISNTILVEEDCSNPNSYTVEGADNTSTSIGGTYSGNYIFMGTLDVNSGVCTIQSADINFSNGSHIIVHNGATLNIDNSVLHSCSQWAGINVENGGTLNIYNNSEIHDAMVAVYSDAPSSSIDIQTCVFLDNHIAVAVKNRTVTGAVVNITNNNTFGSMDLGLSYIGTNLSGYVPGLISAFDPEHTYIYLYQTEYVTADNSNTFEGLDLSQIPSIDMPVNDYPEVYAIHGISKPNGNYPYYFANNTFTRAFNAAIRLESCANVEMRENAFTSTSGSAADFYGRGIYSTGSILDLRLYDNTFDILKVGTEIADAGDIKILLSSTGNIFTNVQEGVICNHCGRFDISSNSFYGNSIETGIQVYDDDYSNNSITSKIGCNLFDQQLYGVVISPVQNPLNATNTSSNQLVNGSPQNIAIIYNTFTSNVAAILGSDNLINQFNGADPTNTFTSSVDWDIAWVDNSSPYAFAYYFTGINNGPGLPTYVLNGISYTSGNWNTNHISTPYNGSASSCGSYDPFISIPPVAPAGVAAIAGAENTISLWPNPADELINISNREKEMQSYQIYDVTGKLVMKGSISSGTSVHVAQLKKGLYLVKISVPSGAYMQSKIVKQ